MTKGKIFLPGRGEVGSISMANLDSMAQLGPDSRDIYDGFFTSTSKTSYPALWGYDAESVLKLTEPMSKGSLTWSGIEKFEKQLPLLIALLYFATGDYISLIRHYDSSSKSPRFATPRGLRAEKTQLVT